MTDLEMMDWIDKASYQELLEKWRHCEAGSPWFQGEVGFRFRDRMIVVRATLPFAERVRISKAAGWEGRDT